LSFQLSKGKSNEQKNGKLFQRVNNSKKGCRKLPQNIQLFIYLVL